MRRVIWPAALRRLLARSGEPVVRQAVTAAIRVLARQFVMGRTIAEALDRAKPAERQGYRHSYDMLGEAARSAADAERYFAAYRRRHRRHRRGSEAPRHPCRVRASR